MTENSPIKSSARRYVGMYLSVIGAVLLFGTGVLTGEVLFVQKNITNAQTSSGIDSVTDLNRNVTHSTSVDFNQFWQVWDSIKEKYVKQPVKDTDIFYGAIQGMVAGLGDPYSVYFPPQAATEFTKGLSGKFSGIGAEIGIKNDQLVIIAPLAGTPAEKAGLHPADRILAIDGKSTLGMDVNTAVDNIRGTPTSSVKLTIMRQGFTKPADFTIHRADINVPSVILSWKTGNVADLRIMQFNENTVPELDTAIQQIQSRKSKGIILDLRNNPGGFLDAAISMASEWVPEGNIVSEKFSGGKEDNHATEGAHRLAGIKTVVLVNKGSASASEIVAGALKDDNVATIVGETTFGKGSVQDFETLPDGSALKVTVAEWYTPSGININKTGIEPQVKVTEDFAKEKVGQDVMVNKALQLLKGAVPTSTKK